jgi:hypothetical protein
MKLYAGMCASFSCVLSIGWHPPHYFNLKKRLQELPDDSKLCEDCQERTGKTNWGEIKEEVLKPFENCDNSPIMDRVLECVNETQESEGKSKLKWRFND